MGFHGALSGKNKENFSCHEDRDKNKIRQNHADENENPIFQIHPTPLLFLLSYMSVNFDVNFGMSQHLLIQKFIIFEHY